MCGVSSQCSYSMVGTLISLLIYLKVHVCVPLLDCNCVHVYVHAYSVNCDSLVVEETNVCKYYIQPWS